MTRVLDVIATTGGKATVETIRQTAARKAAATKGPQGHRTAAIKAARTRKLKAAAAKHPRQRVPRGILPPQSKRLARANIGAPQRKRA